MWGVVLRDLGFSHFSCGIRDVGVWARKTYKQVMEEPTLNQLEKHMGSGFKVLGWDSGTFLYVKGTG